MNRDELKEEIARLTDPEGSFVTVARTMVEASQALSTVIKQNRDFLMEHQDSYRKSEQLLADQIELMKKITAGMEALVQSNSNLTVTIHENDERMKQLLTRVENYFGTGEGLKYEN